MKLNKAPSFVHLNVHSNYSFTRGTADVKSICAAARQRGMRHLALTDTNGFYGLVWFLEAVRREKLIPIIGVEILTENEKVVLLAKSMVGYQNISQIVTERHLEADSFSVVNAVSRYTEDVIVLSPLQTLLEKLLFIVPKGQLFAEFQPGKYRGKMENFCRKNKVPPVATNNVHFINPEEYEYHQLLRAIDKNTSLSRLPENEIVSPECWLKSAELMGHAFPDCPEALESTVHIAEQCTFDWGFGGLIFPGKKVSAQNLLELLRHKCHEGALWRYGNISLKVQRRMDYELDIIEKKGFVSYFLVVEDIVKQSKRTCGRGSAAASIVAYVLGITHVDPIAHNLFFERFLNLRRTDPPDIDVDFAWDERDQILDYVFQKYGSSCTAMVANHNCFKGRGAIREVAKVRGFPEYEISRITKKLRGWDTSDLQKVLQEDPLFRGQKFLGEWQCVLKSAQAIHGCPRHLSVHCGGVVIAPEGLSRYVPIERAAKGVNVIQWEKDQTEEAGLIKIDLLGNRSLAVIRDALAAVKKNYGIDIEYATWNPLQDGPTRELVKNGDTMGVFYVESPAMRQLQRKAGTPDYEHLVIHSSIIRPAANVYIQEYLRRLKGGCWTALHPKLKEILAETYGIMAYQEDVSRVAIALAGFDPGDADQLRKTLSKKNNALKMDAFQKQFFEGCSRNGIALDTITKIWDMILSFTGYSFCKPHSASYALVSFKSAYLRAHYPAEFMAAVISNGGGYYSTRAYLSEAERMGLTILPLDINFSEKKYQGDQKTLRVGFMQLKGIRNESIHRILTERKKAGLFSSFTDLLRRVRLDPADVQILIKAGAMDTLEPCVTRPALVWRLKKWEEEGSNREQRDNELDLRADITLPQIRDYPASLKRQHEKEVFGCMITEHPLALYADKIKRVNHTPGCELAADVGRNITMIGWMIAGKVVATKKSKLMEFYSFEDQTALYETTFFPRAYARFCQMITDSRPYVLQGRVEENYGVATLNVEKVNYL